MQLYFGVNLNYRIRVVAYMARVLIKAKRIGGSIMVRIPKEVVEQEDIKEGEMVEVEFKKARRSWFGSMPGLGPMTKEDEMDTHD